MQVIVILLCFLMPIGIGSCSFFACPFNKHGLGGVMTTPLACSLICTQDTTTHVLGAVLWFVILVRAPFIMIHSAKPIPHTSHGMTHCQCYCGCCAPVLITSSVGWADNHMDGIRERARCVSRLPQNNIAQCECEEEDDPNCVDYAHSV